MDKLKPVKTVAEIAKKHKVSESVIESQLKMGIKVEHEHTKDTGLARKIALQHLEESAEYYTKLNEMESGISKSSVDRYNSLKKAAMNRGNNVPKKVTVTRNGKTFQQTVYVNPDKDKSSEKKQGGGQSGDLSGRLMSQGWSKMKDRGTHGWDVYTKKINGDSEYIVTSKDGKKQYGRSKGKPELAEHEAYKFHQEEIAENVRNTPKKEAKASPQFTKLQAAMKGKDKVKVKGNTYLEKRGENIAVKLYDTDVVTLMPNGDVKLNSGGFMTATTKQRMNEFSNVSVSQKKGEWTVTANGKDIPFKDGMVIKNS